MKVSAEATVSSPPKITLNSMPGQLVVIDRLAVDLRVDHAAEQVRARIAASLDDPVLRVLLQPDDGFDAVGFRLWVARFFR